MYIYSWRAQKKLPNVLFSSENDRPPLIRALLSHVLFKPHLSVLATIKHSNDIWIRWGFPLILVCVELQDLSLSSPPQDPLIGSSKDERESALFSSHLFSFSLPRSSDQSSLPPFIPVLWPTGLSLVAAPLSSHLEYMNKRLEQLKVLQDTDLPLLELNASCLVSAQL